MPSTSDRAATRVLAPGVRTREAWAWAMYDFANSSYTTVVITAIFNAYFVAVVAANQAWASLAWTGALAVSHVLLMIAGPLVGAYADLRANKKRLLLISTVGCVASTAGLALAGPDTLVYTMLLLVFSSFFFGIGENLIAAFLPELATSDSQGKLSGLGWSLGYVGGLLTLGLCFLYIDWASAQGQGPQQFVPATMGITAAMFGIASVPTLLLLRERAQPQSQGLDAGVVRHAALRLLHTLSEARHYTDLRRFLVCMAVYQAGIQAVVALAAIYAQQVMAFSTQDTVLLIVVVNLSAAIGAFGFACVEDRIGHVATIALTLAGWIAMIVLVWAAQGVLAFWIGANIAGVCLGASQSAARAFVGVLSPAGRRGEFFGLWGLAGRLAAIVGPLTYGVASWLSHGDHRLAMLITGSYFVAGLLLLGGIDTARGKRAASGRY
ncbi:MAG: MFS transporter [Telluria sp.]|nr:MFS transporter [Telluria sp.]